MKHLLKEHSFNIIVILSCTFILQSHAIGLFKGMMPDNTVLAWVSSISLEYVALWAWFNIGTGWRSLFALIAVPVSLSMSLVAFLHISEPTSNGISNLNETNEKMILNNQKSAAIGDALKGASKYGVHEVTKKSFDEFAKTTKKQEKLISQKYASEPLDKLKLEFGIQAVIMVFFMIAQIVADVMISQSLRTKKVKTETENENQNNQPEQKEVKAEQTETSNRTTKNKEYPKVYVEIVKDVLAELNAKSSELNQTISTFFIETLEESKSNITKMQYVIDGKEGGIGSPRLNIIKEKLEALNHSN